MNIRRVVRGCVPLFCTLALVAGLLPTTSWSAQLTPFTQWAAECNVPGLDYATPLSTDHANDGSAIQVVSDQRGHNTPIIMVHGWRGKSKNQPGGDFSNSVNLTESQTGKSTAIRSLIGNLQSYPGAAVFTFDYRDYAARWVEDVHIALPLSDAIHCLYEKSHEKVIVVAHSMGGLATRQALDIGGPPRVSEVSQVIEFGTPNTGSLYAAIAGGLVDSATLASPAAKLFRIFLAYCGGRTTESLAPGSLCTIPALTAVTAFDSEAGRALRTGSPEIARLPHWPEGLPVHSLAGDTRYDLIGAGFFGITLGLKNVPGGDQVVSLDSATKWAATTKNVECAYEIGFADPVHRILTALKIGPSKRGAIELLNFKEYPSPCFHVNLMRTLELTTTVLGYVADDIDARQGHEYSATLNGGATMTGLSPHMINVTLTLPTEWVTIPGPQPFNSEVKVVNAQGEERLALQFRDDNLEGACGPTPYKLLEDDPVKIQGLDRPPPNAHTAIISILVASGPNNPQDYPVMLYVQLAGDEPDAVAKSGEICLGSTHFKVGSVFGLMTQALGFNSETEASAFLATPNFQKLKDTMSSLRVALVK